MSMSATAADLGTESTYLVAEAWCTVLRVAEAAEHDDFFELGGDSIAGLRLIARLREHGLALHMQDLYDRRRFSDLLDAVRPADDRAPATSSIQRLPLLPIQLRTLAHDRVDPHHHNDDAVLGVPEGSTVAELVTAIAALLEHHRVLRSRFDLTPGQQVQEVGHRVDVGELVRTADAEPGNAARIAAVGAEAHQQIDLEAGRLLVVRILMHEGAPWALAVVVHHLVCDAVSWEILVADLARAIEDTRADRPLGLTAGTDYSSWAAHLTQYAASGELAEHLTYWRARPWARVARLPRLAKDAPRSLAEISTLRSAVEVPGFRRLAAAYGAEAAVLGALNHALVSICRSTTALIDVVSNGRDAFPDGPDLTRTVGWLAEITPVLTDLDDVRGPAETLAATVRTLRAIPAPRTAFGCLTHLVADEDVRAEFQRLPAADVYLNYRGVRTDHSLGELPELPYRLGPAQCPRERQTHPLKLVCDLVGDVLHAQWRYCPAELDADLARRLAEGFADALRELTAAGGPR